MRKTIIAISAAAVLSLVAIPFSPAHAGIPVMDGTNLTQNIMTAIESASQTLKQIEQYQTQLQQYENQLQNSLAPAQQIWDQAQGTIDGLVAATDRLSQLQNQFGSLDSYLEKFQDLDFYRNSPCFNGGNCTAAERAKLDEAKAVASEARTEANKASAEIAAGQLEDLKDDARQLKRLQGAAKGARGQMEAIGYANQLAGQQAYQLLQMRTALVAQQAAVTAKMQDEANEKARTDAIIETLNEPGFKPSAPSKY
ncbi:P-type conjugative transfer protein TrbJ [Falsochrobactrum sp. TDYN1]|uniref:P-type conjugative transfer protein TrbJ n=1 Tax=Falsochrobactrum tianjinense TaxID=2706015 RepID=A0A949PNJ5_9HYPH|nr:P-type conjugative transfer protein TrbJ [Falsochrobactrum sp. TDYN1]MBV2143749.1 P-type conjugative transfer protein TrbJ [Falsochrobactrum sp. TDYN1]